MKRTPGDELGVKYGMRGILTLPPEKGGNTDLLCDMDECYCPRERSYFERMPEQMPEPNPDWIPTEDHLPRSKAAGGRREPGNVRLAHRRCNRDGFGTGPGHDNKRQKARAEKKSWQEDHPEELAANAAAYAAAEERWAGSRSASSVPRLGHLTVHLMSFDGALVERGFWLYVWRIVAGSQIVLYVVAKGTLRDRPELPHRRIFETCQIAS